MSYRADADCAVFTDRLTKTFGRFTAVRDLTLSVRKGTMFGLLGPNGSGKSTTLKLLTGLLEPTSGQIVVNGIAVGVDDVTLRRSTGVLPETLGLFDHLSLWEHACLAGPLYGLTQSETRARGEDLFRFLDLWNDRNSYAGCASYGMRKKTGLMMALLHNPQTLFLDEPFEGLDPVSARHVRLLLQNIVRKGVTVFLTSHMLEVVESIVDECGIIAAGSLVYVERIEEIRAGKHSLPDIYFKFHGRAESGDLAWLGS